MMREVTNSLIDQVYNGEMTWEQIARAALIYMSEKQVEDMIDRVPLGLYDARHVIKTGD